MSEKAAKPMRMGVRVIKSQSPFDNSELVEKALTPTQVSPEETKNAS